MNQNSIVIKGAREHNLKNIDVEIPRDKLVVLTGLSGCSLFQKAAINGISLNAFTIVYSDDQPDYTLRAAEYIQSQLLSRTGVEVPICEDDSGTYDHEILVGNTNRPLSETVRPDSRNMEFYLTADEDHIAINGDYYGNTDHIQCDPESRSLLLVGDKDGTRTAEVVSLETGEMLYKIERPTEEYWRFYLAQGNRLLVRMGETDESALWLVEY